MARVLFYSPALLLLFAIQPVHAQSEPIGHIAQATGKSYLCGPRIRAATGIDCRPAEPEEPVYSKDKLVTLKGGKNRIRVVLIDPDKTDSKGPTVINTGADTEFELAEHMTRPKTLPHDAGFFELLSGRIRAFFKGYVSRRSSMNVKTGTNVCGIRGTDTVIGHDPDEDISQIAVRQGLVVCKSPEGETRDIGPGQKLTISQQNWGPVLSMSPSE